MQLEIPQYASHSIFLKIEMSRLVWPWFSGGTLTAPLHGTEQKQSSRIRSAERWLL